VCLTVVLAASSSSPGWLASYGSLCLHECHCNAQQCHGVRRSLHPEGMPVAVALTLMIVARRTRSNNILPKGLTTVKTLGCSMSSASIRRAT
jgi:sodium/potassium-transporting ATPase subunit alpha